MTAKRDLQHQGTLLDDPRCSFTDIQGERPELVRDVAKLGTTSNPDS